MNPEEVLEAAHAYFKRRREEYQEKVDTKQKALKALKEEYNVCNTGMEHLTTNLSLYGGLESRILVELAELRKEKDEQDSET